MKYILRVTVILLLSSFPAFGASITYSDKITGNEFTAADANEIKTVVNGKQDRVTGTCEEGEAIATVNSDGTVDCETVSSTMIYPGAGIPVSLGESGWDDSLTLDTDLSSVSTSDDTVPSAKATKALADLKADASDITEVDAYIETFMEGGALNSPEVITGKISVTSFSADHTLTDIEMGGGYVVALATSDYLLDATDTVGSSVCVGNNTAVDEVLSMTAPGTDKFDVSGAVTATGATLESSGDLGDEICVVRTNSTTWKVTKLLGTWGEI